MKTKELIDALSCHIDCADMPLGDEEAKEIIKKLEELDKVRRFFPRWLQTLEKTSC